ncbi:hypothetical protein WJX72_012307 [[Myrmecia] bisecta]|uniref:Uncharacterized protein n=1 Tax=[Myrmecia] bisecta TaxID=41462 RepID=A0AAW1QB10_9CHLO
MEGPFATACKNLHRLKHLEEFTYSGYVPIDISLPTGCVVRLSRVDSVSDNHDHHVDLPDSVTSAIIDLTHTISRSEVTRVDLRAFNTALHQPSAHSQTTWEVDEWLAEVPSLPVPVLKLTFDRPDAQNCPPLPNTAHTLYLRAGASLMQQSFPAVEHLTWYLDQDDMPAQDEIADLFPGLRTLALEGTQDFGDYNYLEGPFATACESLYRLTHLETLTYSGCMPIHISLPKGCVVRLSRVDSVSDSDPDDPDADHMDLPHSVTSAITDLT